ncbi:spondin domain-containing protein [Pedobacter endophyticus]|uniref:Spondin domain-containing protein n=1 Tax=Pedobacter endophyticus TaxID=2789740 RepID=A0A7S9KYP0_9SPHI|nr:spondin domain-containing protein [Pedobacter endophyticus]QPH39267.1 spondin domain-containing protein [Pedobacter endophyticus]
MKYNKNITKWTSIAALSLALVACKKDREFVQERTDNTTISVENVLDSRPLVQSGTFQGTGTPPVTLPGQSTTIQFYAAKGQAITFATMYGLSNDLFFAPENPGIKVYTADGLPIEGDVSALVKLWDNGTRVNQKPGTTVNHPGAAETKNVTVVEGTDAQGNTFLPASKLVKATLKYNGNAQFSLTLENTSGGTSNETPLSPGVWAVSYIDDKGNFLNSTPLFTKDKATANGLTALAESGNNTPLSGYIKGITGIFTPISPILVVVYNGIDNPIYKLGENDRNEGLKALAQKGDASSLAAYLKGKPGIKSVYILAAPTTTALLPMINTQRGGNVSQELAVTKGDRIAIATMYGFSNDWFFASGADGIDPYKKGDASASIALFDNGTAINEFPGSGRTQFKLGGTPLVESKPIAAVPNPNAFTTLPDVKNIIKVTIN